MDFNKTRYIPMSRRRRIYEGKAKTFTRDRSRTHSAFQGRRHCVQRQETSDHEGKGVLNNRTNIACSI